MDKDSNSDAAATQPLLSFDECCKLIIAHQSHKSLNWAVNYAKSGVGMIGNDQRVQAFYLLNNITHWRGDVAKQVRNSLKAITQGWKE